jgi:serine/threonine protein kinase
VCEKPDNLLIDLDGSIKLVDFGIAAQLENEADRRRSSVGTPWYTAPEVILGQEYAFGCDIWSCGCMLLELLTGHPPYHRCNAMAAVYAMTENAHPPMPANVSDAARDFLSLCWRHDTDERPSAHELLQHPWIVDNLIPALERTVFRQ